MSTPFSHRREIDLTPLPEYDLYDVVISEEEFARYRQLVMTESDAAQLKSKIDAVSEHLSDKATIDWFREHGTFMGIDSMTSDAAEKK